MKSITAKIFSALIIITVSITVFFACKKTNPDSETSAPVKTIAGSVSGRITDLNNLPVSNATVTAGTSTTSTDINGQFSLKNVQLNKDAGFVQVTKTGYFDGSRTFLVNASTVNNVKIQLIPKTVSGNFASASADTINVLGGGSVSFSATSVVNATTGAAYNGQVSVSTFYLNPADTNFSEYMPGDLRGISTSNQENILKVFGMASVEMDDASGQKLQLAAGKTATITLPIPSSMQSSAPATIPLWYFDETKGLWKQEGTATKQGANYVGSVAHFTFWTSGQLGQSVMLNATFKDSSGNVLANKLVTITSTVYGTKNSYTDSSGMISGLVPANESLVMNVLDGCGDIMYTQNIGPFSADTNLGNINIAAFFGTATPFSVTLSGTVVNCSNAAVTNGSVQVIVGSNNYNSTITNGSFNITFNLCGIPSSTPATVIAYDVTDTTQSSAQKINITGGDQNIGQIIACTSTNSQQYINLTLNGVAYSWALPDSLMGQRVDSGGVFNTVILGTSASTPTKSIFFVIGYDNAAPGNYTFYNGSINTSSAQYYFGPTTTNVTEYGMVGEYITGTASDSTFSCSYRVRRVQ